MLTRTVNMKFTFVQLSFINQDFRLLVLSCLLPPALLCPPTIPDLLSLLSWAN